MRVAITGASGQVGRELAFLLQRENRPTQLLARDPTSASFLQHDSSRIVAFDFNNPNSYKEALEGVDRLFLSCNSSSSDEVIKTFLSAAKTSGIREIVVMSGMGADKIKTQFLAKLEAFVEESHIPYVALRANWFYQNFSSCFKEMITRHRELTFPDGGAPISLVDARDVAEVASYFLSKDFDESAVGYDITGPESLTHQAVADLFSKHLSYPVGYREIGEKEAREQLHWNDEWLSLFRDIREKITAPVSLSVEKILGKPARYLEDYIKENLSIWE